MQNYKEKGSIVHQFTCFCMENHICENFNPNGLILAEIMNENINKENNNSGFGEALQ